MDEDDGEGFGGGGFHAPSLVSLSSFFSPSLSSRRLSSNFYEPTQPIRASRRLSWVNLEGRLVGAEEASSAKTIGGSLSREAAVAWELFSPIHRILIVAVVAVATADLKKSREIAKLKRSVDLRDQILSSMQQKLDNLCEEVNTMKDRSETKNADLVLFTENKDFIFNKNTNADESKFSSCGCRPCDHHRVTLNGSTNDFVEKAACHDDMLKFKPLMTGGEQEERRMSDLSDWASSITSSADTQDQLCSLAIEQDLYNLQRDEDATINALVAVVNATDAASSKRISELEDVIRRKSMIISKLKKDMAVLEQKVVHLTRLRRPSSASTVSLKLPTMADNLLYDMSSTSPSSSDSDSPVENPKRVPVLDERQEVSAHQNVAVRRNHQATSARPQISSTKSADRPQISTPKSADKATVSTPKSTDKPPISLRKSADRTPKQRPVTPVSPLSENSMNRRFDSSLKSSQSEFRSSTGDQKRNRRRSQLATMETGSGKRWV